MAIILIRGLWVGLALNAALVTGVIGHASAAPTVVATTTILGDVTRVIAADDARVQTLMPTGADPHAFEPSARQAESLRDATLVIANGAGLESGLRKTLESAAEDGTPILEVAPRTAPRAGPDGRPDPHFWTDPRRMEIATRSIADALAARVGPAAGTRIKERARTYRATLRREDARIRARLRFIPTAKRNLVTNHHVLGYFAHRYGFRVVGAVIPNTSTLASPSVGDLAKLAEAIRRARVPAIFVDSSSPRRLAEALAKESDVRVRVISLFSESLGPRGSGANTYLGMIRVNAGRIAQGFAP